MSVLMLQLSLCVLTVIQMTSADVVPDFILQPYDASDELIKPVNPPLLPVGALEKLRLYYRSGTGGRCCINVDRLASRCFVVTGQAAALF